MSAAKKPTFSWEWKFGEGRLHAEGPYPKGTGEDVEQIVRVWWIAKSGSPLNEPLDIYLSDGPECLKSLAEFVAAMRIKHN